MWESTTKKSHLNAGVGTPSAMSARYHSYHQHAMTAPRVASSVSQSRVSRPSRAAASLQRNGPIWPTTRLGAMDQDVIRSGSLLFDGPWSATERFQSLVRVSGTLWHSVSLPVALLPVFSNRPNTFLFSLQAYLHVTFIIHELPRCSLNLHKRSFVINCLFKFIDKWTCFYSRMYCQL